MSWYWNPRSNRYTWLNGSARFLSRDSVMAWVEQLIDAGGGAADTLANLIAGGKLNATDWLDRMRESIKDAYIQQYLLGIGGRNQMTPSDWGSVGGMLKEQYGWLKGFYEEVLSGNLSEAQIAMRARMYMNSAREAYERALAKTAGKAGMDQELWKTGFVRTEHCEDCLGYEAEGWQEMGYFPTPGDGNTVCLTNCKCSKHYRKAATGEELWEAA